MHEAVLQNQKQKPHGAHNREKQQQTKTVVELSIVSPSNLLSRQIPPDRQDKKVDRLCFCKPLIHSHQYISWATYHNDISTQPVISHYMWLSDQEMEGEVVPLQLVRQEVAKPVTTVQEYVPTFASLKPLDILNSDHGILTFVRVTLIFSGRHQDNSDVLRWPKEVFQALTWSCPNPNQVFFVPKPNHSHSIVKR